MSAPAATRGIGATDPVCGMPVAADTPFRTEYDGQAILFCSERCRLVDLGRWFDGSYAIPGPPARGDVPPTPAPPETAPDEPE